MISARRSDAACVAMLRSTSMLIVVPPVRSRSRGLSSATRGSTCARSRSCRLVVRSLLVALSLVVALLVLSDKPGQPDHAREYRQQPVVGRATCDGFESDASEPTDE